MTGETLWQLIGWGTGLSFAIWAWPRFDVGRLSVTYDSAPAQEPCWTEQISSDGRLSYGRRGCHDAGLAEMEARARRGEFDTPA